MSLLRKVPQNIWKQEFLTENRQNFSGNTGAFRPEKNSVPDALDMEKFEDYCYVRRPSRFTKDFLRNDMYFYAATLYSVWTGKCYQKENGKRNVEEIRQEFEKHSLEGEEFLTVLTKMIGHEEVLLEGNLASMVEAVAKVRQRQ